MTRKRKERRLSRNLTYGEAFNSCIYLAVWAEGKKIQTLEGLLYTDDELRKLLSGHLCRRTGYEDIFRTVEKTMYRRQGKDIDTFKRRFVVSVK